MFLLQYKKIICVLTATATMSLMSMNINAAFSTVHLDKRSAKNNTYQSNQFASIDYLTASLDGTEFYAIEGSYTGKNSLYVIDAKTGRTTKKINLPNVTGNSNTYGPFSMIISPKGKMIYIVASTEIIKVDAINKEISAVISTGNKSSDRSIDISGDGLRAISADFADYGGNDETYIHIVDTQKNILTDAIPKGSDPDKVYRSGFANLVVDKLTNKVYLIDDHTNSIAIFDLNTKKLQLNAIPLSSRISIWSMAIDSSHGLLYVIEPDKDVLDIIDVKTKKIMEQVNVGGSPDEVLLSPDGRTAYVRLAESSKVTVVDTISHRIIKTIQVPYRSSKLHVSSDGKQIYTISESHIFGDNWSNVEILDADTGTEINYFPVEKI